MSALCHRDLASYFLIGGRGALHCEVILSVARLDIPFFTPFLLCLFLRGRLCDLCQDEDAKEPPPQLIDEYCCASHLHSCAALTPNRYKSFLIGPVKQRVAPGDLIYFLACFPKTFLEALVSCTPSDGFLGKILLGLIACASFKDSPRNWWAGWF